MSTHFSLDMLERVTAKFVAPGESFDPRGEWENRYTFYALVHNNRKNPVYGIPAGSLSARRARKSGRWLLEIDYRKLMKSGRAHRISGEIAFSENALATPVRWTMAAGFAAPDGSEAVWPRLEYGMRTRGRRIELTAGPARRSIALPPAWASAWSLLDAVQRLPRRPGEPLRFTFFDRNAVAKPNHLLRYREAAEVPLGGRTVRLHGFEHLGDGFVPSVYWVDDSGRLVLFNHSIQGYVLEPEKA
jgi:hypothetical protein